jgi:transposase InsO family protein
MGRVGVCGDNAAMESFFALLQKNVPDRQRCSTREELRLAITTWLERTYHRRRQRRLDRLALAIQLPARLRAPNRTLRATVTPPPRSKIMSGHTCCIQGPSFRRDAPG